MNTEEFEKIIEKTYTDFSDVADRLSFKLINLKKNKWVLSDVPYRQFEDLALVPIYIFDDDDGSGNILIKNNHLRYWDITSEELWENVMESAVKIAPVKIRNIIQTLEEIRKIRIIGYENPDRMLVVSNEDNFFGAGAIFYPGVLKDLARRFGTDLYVVPASVHEVIVVSAKDKEDGYDIIHEILEDVNAHDIPPMDILSNNVYIYDCKSDKLSICKEEK